MPKLADWWFRARVLLNLDREERELNEEFDFHIEMQRRKLVAGGMSPADAEVEARRRFGAVTRERQRARDQWGVGLMRDLASDMRHAFRQFRRRPAFTAAGVLTLSLGIGATVALFSAVRGTLLRPLPVREESQLHVFWQDYNWRGVEFDFMRPQATAFSGIAAYSINGFTLGTGEGTVTALTGIVTAELFDVLGARPLIGRTFEPGDDRPGSTPKVVLSWGLWQRSFGGDSAIVGTPILVDGSPFTVAGVMPREFFFPTPEIQMWRPIDMNPANPAYNNNGWLVTIGRAAPGSSAADVQRNIAALGVALGGQFTYPDAWDKRKNPHTTLLREYLIGNASRPMALLLGASIVLLLMACANVAALVLSRTTDRAHEMSLRTALGAGRGRLIRQIIAESLALALVSGLLGAVLAALSWGVLVRSLPLSGGLGSTLVSSGPLGIDWGMFGVALGVAALVGLVVALAPARSLLAGGLSGISGERSAAGLRGGPRRFHGGMVVVEMALGVTLAAGAFLLVRSVSRILGQDLGFDPRGVVTMDVLLPQAIDSAARRQLLVTITERALALPGVRSVGTVNRLPVRDGGGQGTIESASRPDLTGNAAPNSFNRRVSPGYFDAMGIRIVKGRGFTTEDRGGAQRVAVVSESFAKRFWPDQDPIGQQIGGGGANPVWTNVIGVAEESRLFRMVGPNPIVIFLPVGQGVAPAGAVLVVKTDADEGATLASVVALVRAADSRIAIARPMTMNAVMAGTMTDRLQLRFFLTTFALLALVLGAIGVYGVVSYAVSRRRAEFGVRMALGATAGRVMREVSVSGLRPVVIGVAIGVVASAFLAKALSAFLFEVTPHDLVSLGAAASALLGAGVAAVLIPGLRAGRTSPVEVLRGD
jgi:putative ABC transport system permease protein